MAFKVFYTLEGRTPKKANNVLQWADWYVFADRVVKTDILPGGVRVSTVFIGIDRGFLEGIPILFETMIFGGEHNGYQATYSTWEQAEEGHQKAIELIFEV